MQIKYSTSLVSGFLDVECETIEEFDAFLAHYNLSLNDVENDIEEKDDVPAPDIKSVVGTDTVTVEDAQQAVKDYAARNGIEKGRELLGKFGLKRTGEITPEQAAEIVGACND